MPEQKEHEKIENLVDAPGEAAKAARSLEDATNSNETLEGYQVINDERIPEDLKNEGLEPEKTSGKKK